MVKDLAAGDDGGPGAKGANAVFGVGGSDKIPKRWGGPSISQQAASSDNNSGTNERRTGVDGRQILKRRKQEHRDDAHAEDLHAAAGHVEHESLHRQRLERGDGKVPSLPLLQRLVRAQRFCRRLGGGRGRGRRHRGGLAARSFTLHWKEREREREREREVNVIAVSIFRNGRVYRTFVDTSGKPGGGGSLLHLCSREA